MKSVRNCTDFIFCTFHIVVCMPKNINLNVKWFNTVFAVSTCDQGWYGHVLHDKCYKILTSKQTYLRSLANCRAVQADIVEADSELERKFTLLAVSLDGNLLRGIQDTRCFILNFHPT